MERVVDRFDKYMVVRGLNDNVVTKDLSLSNGLIGKSRKQGRDLSKPVVEKILNFYSDIEEVWLLTGRGEMLKDVPPLDDAPSVVAYDEETYEEAKKLGIPLIPEYNTIYHGGNGVTSEPEHFVAHWSIPQAPKNAYIITMVGNSMAPKLLGGARLLVKPYHFATALDIPFGNVFAVAVADEWGDVYTHVKILRRHPDKESSHWVARSVNREEYDDFDILVSSVRSLAIVVMDINQYVIL